MAILAKEDTEGQPDQTDANGAAKEGSSDIEGESEKEQEGETHDRRRENENLHQFSGHREDTPF